MCLLFALLSRWTDVADVLLRLQFLGKTWVSTLRGEFTFKWPTKKACCDHILHILRTVCLFLGITRVIQACCLKRYFLIPLESVLAVIVWVRRFCSPTLFHQQKVRKRKLSLCRYCTMAVYEDSVTRFSTISRYAGSDQRSQPDTNNLTLFSEKQWNPERL